MSKVPIIRFEGTCDICRADLVSEYAEGEFFGDYTIVDSSRDGLPAELHGRVVTWRRHYATAPEGADPRCARFFSPIYEVG